MRPENDFRPASEIKTEWLWRAHEIVGQRCCDGIRRFQQGCPGNAIAWHWNYMPSKSQKHLGYTGNQKKGADYSAPLQLGQLHRCFLPIHKATPAIDQGAISPNSQST